MNNLVTFVSERKNAKYECARFINGMYKTRDPIKVAKLKNSFWFNRAFKCLNDMMDDEEPVDKDKREESLALVNSMKWPKLKAFAAGKGITVNKRKKDEIITDLLKVLVKE